MSRYQVQRSAFPAPFMSGLAREVDDLQNSIHRMFENPLSFTPPRFQGFEKLGWVPGTEIAETDREITMTVELPGLELKDVHIEVEKDVLTVRGEKRSQHVEKDEKKDFFLEERMYGSFERSFTLPPTIDTDKINATFEKGVLSIVMPKGKVVTSRGREISIQAK